MPLCDEIELDDLPETHREEQSNSRDGLQVVAEPTAPALTGDAAQSTTEIRQDVQDDETGVDSLSSASANTTPTDGVEAKSKPVFTALRVLLGLAAFILAVFAADWAGWTSAQAFRSDCWEQQSAHQKLGAECILALEQELRAPLLLHLFLGARGPSPHLTRRKLAVSAKALMSLTQNSCIGWVCDLLTVLFLLGSLRVFLHTRTQASRTVRPRPVDATTTFQSDYYIPAWINQSVPRLTYNIAVELVFATVLPEATTLWTRETSSFSLQYREQWHSAADPSSWKGIQMSLSEQDNDSTMLKQQIVKHEMADPLMRSFNEEVIKYSTTADEAEEGDWHPAGVTAIANDDETIGHPPTQTVLARIANVGITREIISHYFHNIGDIESIRFVERRGRLRFAFVKFTSQDDADAAVADLNRENSDLVAVKASYAQERRSDAKADANCPPESIYEARSESQSNRRLYRRYRRDLPRSFYKAGRVFSILWHNRQSTSGTLKPVLPSRHPARNRRASLFVQTPTCQEQRRDHEERRPDCEDRLIALNRKLNNDARRLASRR